MKPGYQTTEFWLSLVATLAGAFAASGAIPSTSQYSQLVGLITTTVIPAIYAFLRNQQKIAAIPSWEQQAQAAIDAGKLPPFLTK